ncbi:MAG: oligopeptide transporter, OPT family [Lachnospiraceae bacterium]|nr:oligopeptide transporter, OPT family [Lachnospiraceae bacterium]
MSGKKRDTSVVEFSVTSVLLGVLLAVLFGGANAYLGLRVGMTVSASIPAAVISMGIIRVLLRKDSILESNMVQTIGSAGESVAAGAIFTLPVLFMWAEEGIAGFPDYMEITAICICASILGILFMVPLRNALIVREHMTLPYPEGTACAKVLAAGEEKKSEASWVFIGLVIAGIYKFIVDGIRLFGSQIHYEFKKLKGAGVGVDVLPALISVGYICGFRIASFMLAGGIISWLALMPVISMFGGDMVLFPGDVLIGTMTSNQLWSNYIRYIGAGAVAAAGIISLVKSLPMLFNAFTSSFSKENRKYQTEGGSQERNIPMKWIIILVVVLSLFIWLAPNIPVNFLGTIMIIIFGFFFATVSSRMVGLVGSSNNPVSGMTIATLIISAVVMKMSGMSTVAAMTGTIAVGSIICIISAIAGDTSQDLKTGYILGATPMKQQIGEIIGVTAASLSISGVLYLLNNAWGYGSEELSAPQATLMKLVVEGVMEGNLPWNLILVGVAIAVAVELMGIESLPFAVGMYLPIHLSMGIMIGGIIRRIVEKVKKSGVERGILFTSGMIAGEGLVGIILAFMEVL